MTVTENDQRHAWIGQLHELIGRFVPADGDVELRVGIETGRRQWVAASAPSSRIFHTFPDPRSGARASWSAWHRTAASS
jgi:hypothetical protein